MNQNAIWARIKKTELKVVARANLVTRGVVRSLNFACCAIFSKVRGLVPVTPPCGAATWLWLTLLECQLTRTEASCKRHLKVASKTFRTCGPPQREPGTTSTFPRKIFKRFGRPSTIPLQDSKYGLRKQVRQTSEGERRLESHYMNYETSFGMRMAC